MPTGLCAHLEEHTEAVSAGASGCENRRRPGRDGELIPPCSSVLSGFFFLTCMFKKKKKIKEFIYSFNKQFWYGFLPLGADWCWGAMQLSPVTCHPG